jgi:hypothetical protein
MKKQILSVVAALSVLATLMVAAVYAASLPERIKVDIPFSFTVGKATLPAGEYMVEESTQGVLLIRSIDRSANASALAIRAQNKKNMERPALVFHRYGEEYFLSRVWATGTDGLELPKSRREREVAKSAKHLAQHASQLEIVTVLAE